MRFEEFPSCCGLAVIHELDVIDEYDYGAARYRRNWKSIAEGIEAMEAEAADHGYTYAICASVPRQKEAVKYLSDNGWEKVKRFRNKNTHNWITIWMKKIR